MGFFLCIFIWKWYEIDNIKTFVHNVNPSIENIKAFVQSASTLLINIPSSIENVKAFVQSALTLLINIPSSIENVKAFVQSALTLLINIKTFVHNVKIFLINIHKYLLPYTPHPYTLTPIVLVAKNETKTDSSGINHKITINF
ncbi:hypothetical protein NIES4106_49030 [Fischerella sp. NIES-4106]|nr:hypothetical protein NIES4106_49030 [Fischerella sp. NIES-4106]